MYTVYCIAVRAMGASTSGTPTETEIEDIPDSAQGYLFQRIILTVQVN